METQVRATVKEAEQTITLYTQTYAGEARAIDEQVPDLDIEQEEQKLMDRTRPPHVGGACGRGLGKGPKLKAENWKN